jgi:hypothetical protein
MIVSRRPFCHAIMHRIRLLCITTLATFASLATLALSACASGGAHLATCDAAPRDSIFAAAGPVYHSCAVDRRAELLTPGPRPDFFPPARTACFSAAIEFVVNQQGRPELETAHVLHANDRAFGDALLSTLANRKYQPAVLHGAPVRQIVEDEMTVGTVVVHVQAGQIPRLPARAPRC